MLPWLARRERLDLLHVQRVAPPAVRGRVVLHVHDLLPLTLPRDHRGFRDRLVRRLTPASLRRADGILTVSRAVAAEIRARFPHTAPRLRAVPNGVEAAFFRPAAAGAARGAVHARLGLAGDYVLYLGALMARKNLRVALEGFAAHRAARRAGRGPAPVLVLAGMSRSDAYAAELRALAERIAPGAVTFAGFLPDSDCLALLQQASAFLAPSRGEGFDLPALEAMACGVPVIASDLPVHRELLESDVLYFAPDRPEALAAAWRRLEDEPGLAAHLARRGPARAAGYTWERAMAAMAGFYQDLSQTSSHRP